MKLLIINNNMKIGGVQKALRNLLRQIHGSYDITLLLLNPVGELMDDIPEDVKVMSPKTAVRFWGTDGQEMKSRRDRLCRSILAVVARTCGRGISFSLSAIRQQKLNGYDVVISFLHSGNPRAFYGGCAEFALHCTEAKKKVIFLHNDFRAIQAVSAYNRKLYRSFDYIAACSEGCREAFLAEVPELQNKTIVIPNCHDYENIASMAEKIPVRREQDAFYILTVARFGREKGILRAIRVVAGLVKQFPKVRYEIAGNGREFEEAKKMIKDLALEKNVRLLGELKNPYGGMKEADLLLIPSFAEAAPLVIGEAASLGTPVLSTKTSSSEEMIESTGYGWVCENSEEGIRNGLLAILKHPSLIREKKTELLNRKFTDRKAVQRFSDLMTACKKEGI